MTSVDGMTAEFYPVTHKFLGETAARIINEVRIVNRVFYGCKSTAPGTIELESATGCSFARQQGCRQLLNALQSCHK